MRFAQLRASVVVSLIVLAGPVTTFAALDDPVELAGSWTWSWKDSAGVLHRHVLEVEGSGDKMAARERFDELDPVKVTDLKLIGSKLTFSVQRDKRMASYTGVVKAKDLIEGRVSVSTDGQADEFAWEAKREPVKK